MKEVEIYFSIIIPLYNKEQYIVQTLQSVLNQTYINFEIIIINDGSTDNSEKIVRSINDDRIKLFNQRNRGVSAARNMGIEVAEYEWLVFLDADDIYTEKYLATLNELIEEYREISIFACAYKHQNLIDNSISHPNLKFVPDQNQHGVVNNYFKSCFFGNPIVTSSSICINKKLFKNISGFNLKAKRGEDLDLWFRMALEHNIVFYNKPMVIYRINHDIDQKPNMSDAKGIFPYYKWIRFNKYYWSNIYIGLYIFKRLVLVIKVILINKGIKDVFKYFKQ